MRWRQGLLFCSLIYWTYTAMFSDVPLGGPRRGRPGELVRTRRGGASSALTDGRSDSTGLGCNSALHGSIQLFHDWFMNR